MHNSINAAVADVLDCLDEISTTQMPPSQALAHFHGVRTRHAQTSIELVWEDQSFDASVHYDALIRPAGENKTVSISVCADDALPWALRGLHRWRDSDLLRVNGVTMAVEQAVSQLDVLWEKAPLMQRLIDSCIIEGELQRRNIEVDANDVQAAFDTMRRRRGLLTVQALQAWLRDSGASMATLQDLATKRARAAKLRQVIVGNDAESYFATHSREFDEVKIARFESHSPEVAQRIADDVRHSRATLAAAAQEAFVKGLGTDLTLRAVDRRHLQSDVGLTDAAEGDLQVIQRDGRFIVTQVLAIQPAEHGPATLARVKGALFQEWLAAQRSGARIEWFWGDAQRTRQQCAA